jgi:hypothetical protein
MLMRVRIVRKLARFLNGIDLDKFQVGEVVELPPKAARLLIAEGWAVLVDSEADSTK